MSEASALGQDGETPVNPYNLLGAVNDASAESRRSWLIFLAILTYVAIAAAGVTHKDLLLQTPVTLPLLGAKIPLGTFFQAAPIVAVLVHLGLVTQLTLLARKAIELDAALQTLETSDRRTHPLRLELHSFFFTQAAAGPDRSLVISAFLHGTWWLTLVLAPALLLLYLQVSFLPVHNECVTWIARGALLVDLGLLSLLGVFLARREASFGTAFLRNALSRPLAVLVTGALIAVVALVSVFVATVPGEALDQASGRLLALKPGTVGAEARPAELDGGVSLFGWFNRSLDVRDQEIGAAVLRDRDLRFARLDRTGLQGADLAAARLDGANLTGADLSGATLAGATLEGAVLDKARLAGADLSRATLSRAMLQSALLERALLADVRAEGASFAGAAMTGADLTGAILTAADFSGAALQGASLERAALEGATLRNADLEAATLVKASLQAADLGGARVSGADLRGVQVWQTEPPAADPAGLADFGDIVLRPMDEKVAAGIKSVAERAGGSLKKRAADVVALAFNSTESRKWGNGSDAARWQAGVQAAQADGFKGRLTESLVKAMCKSRWAGGHLATGVARRALAQTFRGDAVSVADRLRSDDCPQGKLIPAKLMRDLAAHADTLRPN